MQSRERAKAGYTPDSFTIENRSKSDDRFHQALFLQLCLTITVRFLYFNGT